jgi:hypothetical protein
MAVQGLDAAASRLGVGLDVIQARDDQDVERAFNTALGRRATALLTIPDAFL